MKLLNQSVKYLSVALLLIVALWAVVFYFSMFNEIKDSIDEELEYQRRLIIRNTLNDSVIVSKENFDENLYTLERIDEPAALALKDRFIDTEILMQDADDQSPELEPVRMLITAFRANEVFYQLKIANPILEQNDLIKALLWNVIGLYTILILSVVLINNFVLKKLWRPFYDFLGQLKSYKIDTSTPLPKTNTNITEFEYLQQAVGEMVEHSLNAYNQQKEFIENASHELQTPLAIASNKLELLFEDEGLRESQAQKLTETYQILQRLTKLNKSLLLLSKIENRQIIHAEEVDFNELVQQNIDELEEFASYKNIQMTLDTKGALVKTMDKTHAHTLVSNLLKNAIYHNMENGTVEIAIDDHQLKIRNTGSAKALDRNKIFDRFQKHHASNSGTGLGLAIVKAIATLYQLQINYSFEDRKHVFKMIFGKS